MLQAIHVTNFNKAQMVLPWHEVIDGLQISDITGIDPVDAEIISSDYAGEDGTEYQEAHRGNRNIVVTLDVDPFTAAGSAQEIRQRLMKFFMPKSAVTLDFWRLGAPNVTITGWVESFDFPAMVREPQVTLSMIFTKPDFVNPVLQTSPGFSTAGEVDHFIDYQGTVDTGFLFRMRPNRAFSGFTIFHRPGDGSLRQMEVSFNFEPGDIVEISTIPREKRATLIRGGNTRSILYAVSPYSEWLRLYPGHNNIVVYLEGNGVPYTVEYTDKIGGL